MSFVIVMVLLLVVMYVLMIRPQRQRQREQQSMIEKAAVGDDVLTTGGIYGTITQAEGDDIVVEIAEGLNVHMTRRGVAAVLPPEEEAETVEVEATESEDEAVVAVDAEVDEVVVADEEDAVRGDAGEDAPTDPRL